MVQNRHKISICRAFSLVEILGGVAVVLTLGTVAVVGIKDTVAAGQRSASQQEIKQLNTSLNNYKSAGGVVPSGYQAGQVLDLLKEGVTVEGSDERYTPLVNDPAMEISIAGDPYSLVYDDNTGFSYEPTSGEGLGIDGGTDGSGTPTPSYPFDIEDDTDTQAAMEAFAGLEYGDTQRQSYLDAFNAAKNMGYLSDEELAQLEALLSEDGLVLNVNGAWTDAPFDYTDAGEVLDALTSMNDISPEEYPAYLQALKAGAVANPGTATEVNTALVGEYVKAVNGAGTQGISWPTLILGISTPGALGTAYDPGSSYIHYPVIDDPEYYNDYQDTWVSAPPVIHFDSTYPLTGKNLSGINFLGSTFQDTPMQATNLTGAQLPASLATALLENANLSGQDLSNTNLTNTLLYGVDLTNVILPTDLSNTPLVRANLSGKDLSSSLLPEVLYSAFAVTDRLTGDTQINSQWTPITPNVYNNNLSAFFEANLSGTTLPSNLAGRSFAGAIFGGQDFSASNLVGTSFRAATNLNTVTLPNELINVSFMKTNLSGKDLSGANLHGATLAGANIAWAKLPTNLVNVSLTGTDLTGRNFSGTNLSGAGLNRANVNYTSFSGATISATTRAPNNTVGTLDALGNGSWFNKTIINWIVQ